MKYRIERVLRNKWSMLFLILVLLLISRLILYLVFCAWKSYGNVDKSFFDSVNIWDSGWYRSIAVDGYMLEPSKHEAGDAANWAFFPLMPLVMGVISRTFNTNLYATGSVVNTLLFTIALLVAAKYIEKTRGSKKTAILFCIVYTLGAYTFYFSLFYTETLFFLLVVIFFYFMHEEKYIIMGIAGALASATRNLGVMLVFAIAVKYTADFLNSKEEKSIKNYFKCAFRNYALVLGVALIPLGLFLYMAYLGELSGDPLAFVHIQRAWGNNGGGFREIARALLGSDSGHILFLASFGAAGGIGCLYMAKKKRWEEAVMGLILILIPLTVRTTSLPRYVMGAFLPVLGLVDILCKFPLWVKIIICTALAVGEIVLFYGWLNGWYFLVV